METLECIKARKSMRKYKSDPVPLEVLKRVLEAVQWAPSWANTQCWEILVVDDAELKVKLQSCLPPFNPSFKAMLEAPLVIVVCGRKGRAGFKKGQAMTIHGDWMSFDCGIASEHLCLAARDQGLGTVHVGLMDHKKAKETLGLPEDVEVFEFVPLGYPADDFKGPGRKALSEFAHWNSFGNKKEF